MGVTTVKLHVSALASLQPRLLTALNTAGLTSAELGDLFARHVSATCVKCDLGLTGDELSQLALAESAEHLADPKLARIRQGYCGREGCDSYFYTARFEDHFKVNWDRLLPVLKADPSATGERAAAEAGEATGASADGWHRLVGTRGRRIGVGIGLLLMLLVARHLMFGGRIPFLQPKPHYVVNPEPIPTLAPPPPQRPGRTNR